METRIAGAILIFIMFFVVGGLHIIFPGTMYRMTANNTRNKKATKSNIISYRIGGIIWIFLGCLFMYALWTGKLD